MDISSSEIKLTVKQVIANFGVPEKNQASGPSVFTLSPLDHQSGTMVYSNKTGNDGVFGGIENAIGATYQAQRDYVISYRVYDRQRIVEAVRRTVRDHVEVACRMIMEKTRMGRYEDKLERYLVVINRTPSPNCLNMEAISGDEDLILGEYASFDMVAVITLTTNPTETIIDDIINMIAGRDAVVFNVHPMAKQVSAYCLQLLNQTTVDVGRPEDLIAMAKEPTVKNMDKLAANPHIHMVVGTGGMGMVDAPLHSGKETIGTETGNPPVIADGTVNVELTGREIYKGVSFDSNTLCSAGKETFMVGNVADGFLYNLHKQGTYLLDSAQAERLLSIVFQPKKQGNGYEVDKRWMGRDASRILEQMGITGVNTRLLICEVEKDHPLVTVEQMMPILPIIRCRDFEQAVRWAVEAEHGSRHTTSIFSKDVEHITRFAGAVETTTYVKNRVAMAGVDIRGEDRYTMTIVGPTGEGITNAKNFAGRRRCMLMEGGLRTI